MTMTAYEALIKALGAAKKYTDSSIAGAGSLKGANCTIKSIEPINGGNRVTFEWTENDGTVETDTMDVMDGVDGEGIPIYNVMPSTEALFSMSNNSIFRTDGFYDRLDGQGGYYFITTTWTKGSLKIEYNSSTRYLVPLHEHGVYSKYLEVGRFGLRAYNDQINWETITPESTYATLNSSILSNIIVPTNQATFKFPTGNFFFETGINIDSSHRMYNIEGETVGSRNGEPNALYGGDYSQGTELIFPFLSNGDIAVKSGIGSVRNVVILGNPRTYNITFDRSKVLTAPNEVVTETIAEDSGTQIKCTGLWKSGGNVYNVYVINFYTGMKFPASNTFVDHVYASYCHIGVNMENDVKCVGVYGANVHTLIQMYGAISSVVSARVDSCVHAVHVTHGSGFTLSDIDGDWCTDSLILMGREGQYSTVQSSAFSQIHGRCCVLKWYDSDSETSPKMSELVDTEGYGIIRVLDKTTCDSCHFLINSTGGGVQDNSTRYKSPDIILTHEGTATKVTNCTIICPCPTYFKNFPVELFDRRSNWGFNIKYDTLDKIYRINNAGIYDIVNVGVTQTLSSGTKIGSISVDGTSTDLFAPSGSGGASALSELDDVYIDTNTLSPYDTLRYNPDSGDWFNAPCAIGRIDVEQAVTEYTLSPNVTYNFIEPLEELDVTLATSPYDSFVEEYHFFFKSGSTPTELSLPSDVIVPDDFSVEANKVYEISIMNRLMLYNSWTLPEEPEQN